MKYLLDNEETERLYFRKIDRSDFSIWLEFFKDSSSFQHWISELKAPEVECNNWYEKQFNRYETGRGGMNALIEKQTGNLIGHAGLVVQEVDGIAELEIAYSLLAAGRNKGYASEAARKCMEVAFQNNYANSLISIISLTNLPSSNVALKNGMKLGKQTIYHENTVNIFRITKEEWKNARKDLNPK
jgi:ribosomal-protein-alanine N-acetyltransferase